MTITIIKQGVDPITLPQEVSCRTCKTQFTCERVDCKFHDNPYKHNDQRETDYFSVNCPTCGQHCTFTNFNWRH